MTVVSILSAVHNEEAHIEEMISSVRAQCHENWELLFVSDGSTDATDELISAASAIDNRVRLVHSRQKIGKVKAFNLAFANAVGDLVVLLAGDDTIPRDSLAVRVASLAHIDRDELAVAFFKLTSFSEDPRHDGMVLPRGDAVSRSGGTITMTRGLARIVFPVDPSLISEDTWLSRAAEGLADTVVKIPHSVLNYRIHPGNSNPRMRPFSEMTTAMAQRHEAWRLLLECDRFELSRDVVRSLELNYQAELLRRDGRVFELLRFSDLSWPDRAGFISQANPLAFRLRQRFYRWFSGRRGR